jgi:DNA segregation ATPase FtsK/SpoIIIE-like protein
MQMVDEGVLSHLSVTLQRHVSARYNERVGAWYIVARNSSIGGIPSFVRYSDMMKYFPDNADGLSIPIGMGVNNRRLYKSIGKMPHLLIAGTTGGGKSNGINFILCTLIQRNTPQQLGLVLVDLKGGMELNRYKGVPHLMTMDKITNTGIVKERAGVPALLDWMINEGKSRQRIIEKSGRSDVLTFNAAQRSHPERRLKPIVIVVDELSDILLDSDLKKQTLQKLILIAQQFRAVGIHMLLCTQTPTVGVIPTLLKSNLPAKMAFPCSSNTASIVIIDSGDARGLPTGRCVYDHTEKTITQTPYISPDLIRGIIERAREGKFEVDTSGRDVTETEILEWALDNLNGKLSAEKLFKEFQNRITWADLLQTLRDMEGREVELAGQVWKVLPPAGSAARRLDLIRDDETVQLPDDVLDDYHQPEQTTEFFDLPKETVVEAARDSFADAFRAVLDAHECKIEKREIHGPRIFLPLDEFLFTDQERRAPEMELLADIQKVCARFGAVPVAGGFAINGKKVKLGRWEK